jgi:hypothetical protein
MTINLRVVGIYFQKDIAITVTPGVTSIKDVMNQAKLQFPSLSYKTSTKAGRETLYEVSYKEVGAAGPYTLRDSDRSKDKSPGQAFQTWQSYIVRAGTSIGLDNVFVPFSQRFVEDGDNILWRLVAISKKYE